MGWAAGGSRFAVGTIRQATGEVAYKDDGILLGRLWIEVPLCPSQHLKGLEAVPHLRVFVPHHSGKEPLALRKRGLSPQNAAAGFLWGFAVPSLS